MTNSNAPSPLPHQSCPHCKENLRRDPRATVAIPRSFVCGSRCAARYAPAPDDDGHSVDGGSARGRARLAEGERAQAAQEAARRPPPVPTKCKAVGCETTVEIPVSSTPARIQEILRSSGWTRTGFCGQGCERDAPRPLADPAIVAAAELATARVRGDVSYMRTWAHSRKRAGLPTLEMHREYVDPEVPPASPAPAPPPPPPPPVATKGARGVRSTPLGE